MNTLHAVLVAIPSSTCPNTPECVAQQRCYAAAALGRSAALSGAPDAGYVKGPDESPVPNEGFRWSVSHKRYWAAGVVSRAAVGIDIESIVPRRQEFFDEIAGQDEWGMLGGRSTDALFRIWTAKEAVLKANGMGIGHMRACRLAECLDDLQLKLLHERRLWHVHQHLVAGHLAAVATEAGRVMWNVLDTSGGIGRDKRPKRQ